MRRIIVFALAIVSLCMFPRFAFAGGTEQVVSDGGENVMVVAYNRFNAALLMLGVSPDDTRLDAVAKAKLSNASTGGRFYVFVQAVEQYDGLDIDDVFGSIGFGVLRLPWVTYCAANGMHIYTYAGARDGALEDLQTVLAGGDLGGGSGGGGEVGKNISFYGNRNYTSSSASYGYYAVGTDTSSILYHFQYTGTTYTVKSPFTIKMTLTNELPYSVSEYDYFASLNTATSSNSRRITITIFAFKKNTYTLNKSNNQYSGLEVINTVNATENYYRAELSSINNYTCDGEVLTFSNAMTLTFYQRNPALVYSTGYDFLPLQTSGPPVVPPTNWPDNPTVTPTPQPEPPSDTPVYPPQVTGPDVTVPQTPDLSDVLDALNEHCQHLQDVIYNGFNDYYETITSYYSDVVDWLQEWMEYFDRVFDDAFGDIKLYQQTGNYWLNQIYNKLDDINKKLDALGSKLESDDIPSSYDDSNVATDGSSVLAGAYNNLRTKFPFSLLDSLANFATRLKHQAVAPDFDLPVGNPFGSNDPFTVEIDLTPYSDWASIVRTGEVLAVYIALARRAAAMWTREGEGA